VVESTGIPGLDTQLQLASLLPEKLIQRTE